MGSLLYTSVALAILAVASAIQPPLISLLEQGGIIFTHADEPGMTLFAVHYSINKPLPAVLPGDWNFDVNSKTGDLWIHINEEVDVFPGDTVNYWILIYKNGDGEQLIEQSWTATNTTQTIPTTVSTPRPTTLPTQSTIKNTQTTQKPGEKTTTAGGSVVIPTNPKNLELVFSDNFDKLDFNKWEHEITASGGGNWEFQYYLNNRSNSYVRDGTLFIKPTLTSEKYGEAFLSSGTLDLWGGNPASVCTGNNFYGCLRAGNPTNYINPIQSARLRTVKSFNIRYGKIEVEAQLPKGDWIWPAIWMLPKHDEYGTWPASGEIDIMESRGNLDLKNEKGEELGNRHVGSTLHWGPYFEENKYALTSESITGDFSDSFHKYTLEWDESSIKISVDNNLVLNVAPPAGGFWELGGYKGRLKDEANPWVNPENLRMAPFDKEFFIVLNVAVGGTNGFFQDNWTNGRGAKPWKNTSPVAPKEFWLAKDTWYPTWNADQNNGEGAAMKVKSVKVWKYVDSSATASSIKYEVIGLCNLSVMIYINYLFSY